MATNFIQKHITRHLSENLPSEILARFSLALIFFLINKFYPVFKQNLTDDDDWNNLKHYHHEDSIPEVSLLIVMILLPVFSIANSLYMNSQLVQKYDMGKNYKLKQASKKNIIEEGTEVDTATEEPETLEVSYSFYVDWVDALLSYSLAVLVNGILTELIKKAVGRPRPDYFNRCFPDIDLENKVEVDLKIKSLGVTGFQCSLEKISNEDQADWLKENPTNKFIVESVFDHDETEPIYCDMHCLEKGRRSFPSGHSSNAWVAFFFFSLYLWGKFKAFTPKGRQETIRFIPGFIVMLAPLYIALSRMQDYRHHWEDVTVGSLLGIFSSIFGYLQYYPSLYDYDAYLSNRQIKWILMNRGTKANEKFKVLRKRVRGNFGLMVTSSRMADSDNEQ